MTPVPLIAGVEVTEMSSSVELEAGTVVLAVRATLPEAAVTDKVGEEMISDKLCVGILLDAVDTPTETDVGEELKLEATSVSETAVDTASVDELVGIDVAGGEDQMVDVVDAVCPKTGVSDAADALLETLVTIEEDEAASGGELVGGDWETGVDTLGLGVVRVFVVNWNIEAVENGSTMVVTTVHGKVQ